MALTCLSSLQMSGDANPAAWAALGPRGYSLCPWGLSQQMAATRLHPPPLALPMAPAGSAQGPSASLPLRRDLSGEKPKGSPGALSCTGDSRDQLPTLACALALVSNSTLRSSGRKCWEKLKPGHWFLLYFFQ